MIDSSDSMAAKVSQPDNLSHKLNSTSSSVLGYSRFCTVCGSPLDEDDLFCSECGNKIEQEKNVAVLEKDAQGFGLESSAISSDRMASIIQTSKLKLGEFTDEFKKPALSMVADGMKERDSCVRHSPGKKAILHGHYVHKASDMTQYLIFDNVVGHDVEASVRTTYANGGYSIEFYKGMLSGSSICIWWIQTCILRLSNCKFPPIL